MSVCLVSIGLVAVPAVPARAATVTASGPIASGIAGKCADVYGNSSSNGAIVDLWDCNGTGAQDWSVMDDGTIQINGKCLDIVGAGTTDGTLVDIWDCNGGGNQQWQQQGGALVNPASGLCLDDPGSTTSNGTQLQIYDCNGTAAQQWSLPSTNSTTGGGGDPVALTYPGGDVVASVDDGGIDPAAMSQYLSTNLPQAVGLQPGASLSDLFQATYNKMRDTGQIPSSEPPPTFSGGSMTVSGSTVTVDIPAASVQAMQAAAASEPPNGTITGPGGTGPKCLHAGSASSGTPVNLQDCDGSQAQHFWMMPDGTIQIFEKCLTATGTGNGASVVLSDCNGGNSQQWQLGGNHQGSLTNAASGRCLDSPGGSTANGTQLQIYDCIGGDPQTWNWPGVPLVAGWVARFIAAVVGGITGAIAYAVCLAFFTPVGGVFNPAVLAFCGFWWTFVWTLLFSLVTDVLIAVPLNGEAWKNIITGALVAGAIGALGGYFGIALFQAFPNAMRNAAIAAPGVILGFGKWIGGGLSSVATRVANTVKGWLGNAADAAPIELPPVLEAAGLATSEASGPITSGIAGKCVDALGAGTSNGTVVDLNDCNGDASAQTWTAWSNGNVSISGRCLDIVGNGTANGTGVQLWECNGAGGQVWQQNGNTLMNPQSGRCLDVLNSNPPNGTQLKINDCNGGVYQQFTLPGGSSGANNQSPALRVLPFGDSITSGIGSSSGSGYRCDLESRLANYQFVGSLTAGSGCSQEQNEGHSGWTIGNLASIENCTITGYEPNVVLLDIGTNDVNVNTGGVSGGSPSAAASAIENLIGSIRNDDPGVVIVVGGLIPTPIAQVAANMTAFNSQVSGWVSQQQGAGAHLVWADMSAVTTADLSDGLHPNDTGYQLMANAWANGIDTAINNGWVNAPNAPATGSGCSSGGSGGGGSAPPAPVWTGLGEVAPGVQASGWTDALGQYIQYADVTGSGRADYLFIRPDSSVLGWYNPGVSGGINWQSMGLVAPGVQGSGWTPGDGNIEFADMTGDGRADYLWVRPDSSVMMWYNSGLGSNGDPVWLPMGQIAAGVQGSGWTPGDGNIQFADMNGDGRADYLWVRPDSSVLMWENPGINPAQPGGYNWIPEGEIAPGVQASGWTDSPGQFITFADLTGSGRADYLFIRPDSSVLAWYNPGVSNGVNWQSMGLIAPGVQGSGWTGPTDGNIQFADMNGDSRADYIWTRPDSSMLLWLNNPG